MSTFPFQWPVLLWWDACVLGFRLNQTVANALMRTLCRMVRLELVQRLEEGVLPYEDKSLQAFLLDGVHETFREGVEVR